MAAWAWLTPHILSYSERGAWAARAARRRHSADYYAADVRSHPGNPNRQNRGPPEFRRAARTEWRSKSFSTQQHTVTYCMCSNKRIGFPISVNRGVSQLSRTQQSVSAHSRRIMRTVHRFGRSDDRAVRPGMMTKSGFKGGRMAMGPEMSAAVRVAAPRAIVCAALPGVPVPRRVTP